MHTRFRPDPNLFPFESRWFESSVGRIHYVDEGSGRPLILLHGNPTWSFLYRNIIALLDHRFRCIAVDYPGFGLSVRPEGYGYTPVEHARIVGELIDQLDVNGFIVMGQDWGGPVGTRVACERPAKVAGLVLGNTWFWPIKRPATVLFSRLMSSPPMQRAILERNFFVEKLIPAGTARRLSEREMEHYRGVQPDPAARVGIAEFPRHIRAATPMLQELSESVPRLLGDKRVLLVWGMKDFAFPPWPSIARIRSCFDDVTVVELEAAKHFIQEEDPDRIAEAILDRFVA